ncbi:MAG: AraC family transcriptional regulator [Bacteroidota bacterium]
MILIPQRLFDLETVSSIYRAKDFCLLHKQLKTSSLNRECYLSQPAISLVRKGRQKLRLKDGGTLHIEAGKYAFLPQGLYHITDLVATKGEFESVIFFFHSTQVHQFLSGQPIPDTLPQEAIVFCGTITPTLSGFIQNTLDLFDLLESTSLQLATLKFQELLHLLAAENSTHFLAHLFAFQRSLPRQLSIIMEQYFDKALTVEDYAFLSGRSVSSFRRDFKRHYAQSPKQWLKTKRLDKAKKLLTATTHSVTEVSEAVGYENVSYFIRAFRQTYGQTPGQLLQEHQSS